MRYKIPSRPRGSAKASAYKKLNKVCADHSGPATRFGKIAALASTLRSYGVTNAAIAYHFNQRSIPALGESSIWLSEDIGNLLHDNGSTPGSDGAKK